MLKAIRTWSAWRRGRLSPSAAPLAVLGVLTVAARVRTAVAFEIDALTSAVLSGLLFGSEWAERRRARAVAARVGVLRLRKRFGPLSAEDIEAIEALRAEGRRLAQRRS